MEKVRDSLAKVALVGAPRGLVWATPVPFS